MSSPASAVNTWGVAKCDGDLQRISRRAVAACANGDTCIMFIILDKEILSRNALDASLNDISASSAAESRTPGVGALEK